METVIGTFNNMEIMEILSSFTSDAHQMRLNMLLILHPDRQCYFSTCQREIVLSSIGYQKCLRCIKDRSVWVSLIKIMTSISKGILRQVVKQHICFKIMK